LYLGELRGKWEMFLITPDQKILRNPKDLKLYIAKSGAVIDSNIVNFALPKKTAKVRNKNSKLNSQKCSYIKIRISKQIVLLSFYNAFDISI
jgi:hypothetical protein